MIISMMARSDRIAADLAAKNLTTVEAYAEAMNSFVDSVKFVNFATRRIAGMGVEPKMNAMVSLTPVDKVSAPVKGNNGVYVFKSYAKNKENKTYNEADEIRMLNATNAYRFQYQVIQQLIDRADVEDNRIRFY